MNGADLTSEQLAGGRRMALVALAGIVSDNPDDAEMASEYLRGADDEAVAVGCLMLVIDALVEHGASPAEWIAAKQDEAAALADD